MKLPAFLKNFFPQKKEEKKYFLALDIKAKVVKAAVWQKDEKKASLINLGSASYSGDWEEAISAADEAIVEASGNVPQTEIKEVVLGISRAWTDKNKILAMHKSNLKKLCDQLALKPLGFVIISEAIAKYLKQIEGVPPTALLIGVEEKVLTITLVKAGRIEGSAVIERKEENALPNQVEEALRGFAAEVLPSRILLHNEGKDLGEIRDDLLAYQWSEKLPFLHLPKIEILDEDYDIKALTMTSGMQMDGVLVSPEDLLSVEKKPRVGQDEKVSPASEEKETLGFVKDKDVLATKETKKQGVTQPTITPEETGGDSKPSPAFKLPSLLASKLSQIQLPQLNFSFWGEMKWLLIIGIFILAIGGGGIFAAYWYLPKAEVAILVAAKTSEKEEEIVLSPNPKNLEGQPGQFTSKIIELEVEGERKAAATGKKKVGDPAKGEIVIYNKTENEKKFPSGTILVGPGSLEFTLDEEVMVASTAAFSTDLSSASGKVTAAAIGEEGNLSAGSNFSFDNFPTSSYFAKGEKDFSGGTSREVSIVSKDDQGKLKEALLAELTQKAKEQILENLNAEEKLVEDTLESTIKMEKFGKEVGEEASEFDLKLSMAFKATVYNEKELKGKLLEEVVEEASEGYEISKEETKIEVLEVKTEKDGEVALKVALKIKLLPKLDLGEIRKNIVGKKKPLAEDYLKSLGNIANVEIKINSVVPVRFRTLPHRPQNIKIEIIST